MSGGRPSLYVAGALQPIRAALSPHGPLAWRVSAPRPARPGYEAARIAARDHTRWPREHVTTGGECGA